MKGGIVTDDNAIITLFNERDPKALEETDGKYGAYLRKTVGGILRDESDREEVLNDVYLKSWNSIPPDLPRNFKAYLAKIARRTALDAVRKDGALKRVSENCRVSFEELSECIPSGDDPAKTAENKDLTAFLNRYLTEEKAEKRKVFLLRYFSFYSYEEISLLTGFSVPKLKSMLLRMRRNIREELTREGYL